MTLRWVEGFEVAKLQSLLDRRYGTLPAVNLDAAGRRGGLSLTHNQSATPLVLSPTFRPAMSERACLVGLAFRFSNAVTNPLIRFMSGVDEKTVVWFVADSPTEGHLEVRNDISTLATTDVLPRDTWFFLEAKVFCDVLLGRVEVRIEQAPIVELTSVDTRGSTPSNLITKVEICAAVASGGTFNLDDIYIASDASFDLLTFLGDVTTTAIAPVSDGLKDFTPTPGAVAHFSTVDDIEADDAGTFIAANGGTNATDTFRFAEATKATRGPIMGLAHSTHTELDAAGSETLKQVTADADGAVARESVAVVVTTTTWRELLLTDSLNAAAAPIERQDIDDQFFGVRVT